MSLLEVSPGSLAGKLLGMRKAAWIIALHGADQRREVARIPAGAA